MRSSERAVNNRKRNVNAKTLQKQTKGEKIMAFETPKTDWKPESVPTEEDFNRIEKNIAHLNDAVTVGTVQSALCDQNGNNIAGTYLGTSSEILSEIDAPIGYMTKIPLKKTINNYKYLMFLLKGNNFNGHSSYMIERKLFADLFDRDQPLILECDGNKLFFYYYAIDNILVPLNMNKYCFLTVYGLN